MSSGGGSKVGETFHTLLHFHIVCVCVSISGFLLAMPHVFYKLSNEYLFIKRVCDCRPKVQI